jgi:phosphoribosylformylglycinamidine synthase
VAEDIGFLKRFIVTGVKAIVVTGNGTNCEMEMAHACRLAGCGVVDIVNIWDIYAGRVGIGSYEFLNLPGGFMDGDDLGSAKAGANRFKFAPIAGSNRRLIDDILKFIEEGKLILGVCNGFQLLVKLGLVPAVGGDRTVQEVTLMTNDSGRFEDRWICMKTDPASPCVFTRGMGDVMLPVRHGEGKFVPMDDAVLAAVREKHLAPLRYCLPDCSAPTLSYPHNPNGSVDAIAGLCDSSGRVFGLMPHPEAFLHRTNHPRWTREPDIPEEGAGLGLFKNAVEYLK